MAYIKNKTSCSGVPPGGVPEKEVQDMIKKEPAIDICCQEYFNYAIGL
tara:strand:- start:419 stop:562 length:144 start_codon:yes stop_codon:yes gene_type:complete